MIVVLDFFAQSGMVGRVLRRLYDNICALYGGDAVLGTEYR